ncbi:MAG: hypothetical protein HXY50_11060 [Ignavibacteriaceae bacterium]|nr:hypothetical protein [Ignavibacteriaceae bacterium]
MHLRIAIVFFYSAFYKHTRLYPRLILFFYLSYTPTSTFCRTSESTDGTAAKLKVVNPLDLSALRDGEGGAYIFWRESQSSIEGKVYFSYHNPYTQNSTELNKFKIAEWSTLQKNPIFIPYISNTAIVAWKDYSNNFNGEIFLQRVSKNQLLWGELGVCAATSAEQIFDFSVASDNAGNIFLAYVSRSEYPSNDYKILYQRILSDGSLAYRNESVAIDVSERKKNKPLVIPNNKGEAFVLWTEKINNKESLLLKKLDPSGKSILGKKPVRISSALHNVNKFSINALNNSFFYIAWETEDQHIFHQLINDKGKALWAVGGAKAVMTKDLNGLVQCIQNDSSITLTWLNEHQQKTSLFAQRFKFNGKEVWKKNGIKLADINNNQSKNFSFADDGDGGMFISWVSNTYNELCKLNFQRLCKTGELLWDSVSSNSRLATNCNFNFFSIHPDSVDRVLVVYTCSSDEICITKVQKSEIPKQEIFNLNSELIGKSVKLVFYTNIKNEPMSFVIERLKHSDTSANVWEYIGNIDVSTANYDVKKEYYDIPSEFGTLYYRAILKSSTREILSNISRIDYLESESKIIVAQNNPNPFKDSTSIGFYLPYSAAVGFEFFNSHAEKIAEFPEKIYPAGENSVTLNLKDYLPGIYFFRFYSKDFVEVKKMIKVD